MENIMGKNKFLPPFFDQGDEINSYHLYEAMQQAQEFIHQQNRLGNVNRKTMKALLYLEKAMKDEEWVVYYPQDKMKYLIIILLFTLSSCNTTDKYYDNATFNGLVVGVIVNLM